MSKSCGGKTNKRKKDKCDTKRERYTRINAQKTGSTPDKSIIAAVV